MTEKQKRFIKKISKLIREKRIANDLSQEELAWKCGLSQTSVCFIELAKGDIKLSNIVTIFEVLGIDFGELNKFYTIKNLV